MQTQPTVSKFWFLTSTRFYAAVIACVQIAFGNDGIATTAEIFNAVLALSGLFILLKTAHNDEALAAFSITPQSVQNNTTIVE